MIEECEDVKIQNLGSGAFRLVVRCGEIPRLINHDRTAEVSPSADLAHKYYAAVCYLFTHLSHDQVMRIRTRIWLTIWCIILPKDVYCICTQVPLACSKARKK
jgi:hypothetical protein